MLNSKPCDLTDFACRFLEPSNATHRQYEALRAYFVEGLSSAQAARRFGYMPGSFRVLVHKFRQNPDRPFFLPPRKVGPSPSKSDHVRERIVALRKQNLSIYEIAETLDREGTTLSAVRCWQILREEGFARLPRRGDEERRPRARPERAAVADVRQLELSPRQFRTKFGGLFLFAPYLAQLPLEEMMRQARLPGSRMIPAAHAIRSLLALKLWGNPRWSHVMSNVFDEGLALFAGLNTIAKRAFLTEYSCRIDPAAYPRLMRLWFDAVGGLGLERGTSFDLDFHPIPFHGEDALMEKHYVTKRSRRQKAVLAFLAQDAQTRVFCYGNAQVRKADQNDEILRFVEFWRQRTGGVPDELIFDSKLTTYANVHRLNTMGIQFITLRRRSRNMLDAIARQPRSAWRRIELEGVSRQYKTPRVLDERIALRDYPGPLRQITVADLGHEDPTILLTNQMRRAPATLVERYAKRMLIENNIADGVEFFHMDALSSAVAMKVNCDVQLTLMASSLYHLLATQIGNGYQNAKSAHLFRDFVDATAQVTIAADALIVRFQKRAHNPLLLAAGFDTLDTAIPWLGNKRLRLAFG